MPPDPIAWLALEPGHKVVTADDQELGKVDQVLGDEVADIFDGLAVAAGLLGRTKYVPAEVVASIDADAVRLAITKAEADRLDEYSPPDREVP